VGSRALEQVGVAEQVLLVQVVVQELQAFLVQVVVQVVPPVVE